MLGAWIDYLRPGADQHIPLEISMGIESVVCYAMTSLNTQHDLTSSFAAETLFSDSTHCT